MKAMILAAGRGERMRPLTDTVPKPLIKLLDKSIIEYHLLNLARAGCTDVVINVAWLGQKIIDALGNGERYDLNIVYSDEANKALETGGGVYNALPLLSENFLLINGDIWTDYPFEKLLNYSVKGIAHLVLVNNPEHNFRGDFAISEGQLTIAESDKFTYSGIGVYTKEFFKTAGNGKYPLAPMIRSYIAEDKISGELYQGNWVDIGTQQRLEYLVEVLGPL